MKLSPISKPPLTAVADSPRNRRRGYLNLPETTPRWKWKSVPFQESGTSNHRLVTRRRWSYIIPPPGNHRRDFSTTTAFLEEAYPAGFPFTMSPTKPSPEWKGSREDVNQLRNSDDVKKTEIFGTDFAFLIPVLILFIIVGVILICMIRRRQRLNELRHKLVPVYHFAPGEDIDEFNWNDVELKESSWKMSPDQQTR